MANLVDLVWSSMVDREVYSPEDLAESLGQPVGAIVRVLEFLTRYGFSRLECTFPSPSMRLRYVCEKYSGSVKFVVAHQGPTVSSCVWVCSP